MNAICQAIAGRIEAADGRVLLLLAVLAAGTFLSCVRYVTIMVTGQWPDWDAEPKRTSAVGKK